MAMALSASTWTTARNPETGKLAGWADDVVGHLKSYTEISPSGTGIKLFVRGELPETFSKNISGQMATVRPKFFEKADSSLSPDSENTERRTKFTTVKTP